jgi:hypothetical protein
MAGDLRSPHKAQVFLQIQRLGEARIECTPAETPLRSIGYIKPLISHWPPLPASELRSEEPARLVHIERLFAKLGIETRLSRPRGRAFERHRSDRLRAVPPEAALPRRLVCGAHPSGRMRHFLFPQKSGHYPIGFPLREWSLRRGLTEFRAAPSAGPRKHEAAPVTKLDPADSDSPLGAPVHGGTTLFTTKSERIQPCSER